MYGIEEIGRVLENAGLGTLGTDILIYSAPPERNKCILVIPGNDPPTFEPETPNYFIGKYQVIVRHPDYGEGVSLSRQIGDVLTMYNVDLDTIKIKQSRPLYQVRVYRRSDSGVMEFSNNFDIRYILR